MKTNMAIFGNIYNKYNIISINNLHLKGLKTFFIRITYRFYTEKNYNRFILNNPLSNNTFQSYLQIVCYFYFCIYYILLYYILFMYLFFVLLFQNSKYSKYLKNKHVCSSNFNNNEIDKIIHSIKIILNATKNVLLK